MEQAFTAVMTTTLCFLLSAALAFPSLASAKALRTFINELPASEIGMEVKLRVGIQDPEGEPVGDILYLHGFADRLDNHRALFDEWTSRGFRVISFDFPSHGDTSGAPINEFTFTKLAQVAHIVERETRVDNRPLLVAGWSTGGLLALRMVQADTLPKFEREIKGLILFAPGVYVRNFVGQPSLEYPLGEVTLETLTHDPHYSPAGELKPKSPGSHLWFALALRYNSILSQYQRLPTDLQTLIFVAGDHEDVYVRSRKLLKWSHWQILKGANIETVTLPGARHGVDFESIEFHGSMVRRRAGEFALEILKQSGRQGSQQNDCEKNLKAG